jgi:hypothetical protein
MVGTRDGYQAVSKSEAVRYLGLKLSQLDAASA